MGRPDDGNAFVPDTTGQARAMPVPDAEAFAEEFIDAATRAGPVELEAEDEVLPEEVGGPFIFLDDDGSLPPESFAPPSDATGQDTEREPKTEIEEEAIESQRQEARGADWEARGV